MTINSSTPAGKDVTLVLLYCGIRTGNFGMGSHARYLMDYFSSCSGYDLILLRVDSKDIGSIDHRFEGNVEIIEIPQPENQIFFTDDDSFIQKVYAKRISEIVFPILRGRKHLVFLCNSVVHYELAAELKRSLSGHLVYVHHNFTWKACLKTSYDYFATQWQRRNFKLHPAAFRGTVYQANLANLSDFVITVTYQAERFFVDVLNIPAAKIMTIYNGLPSSTRSERTRRAELRKKYGFGQTEKIILFCGRIADEKGVDYLIRAFKLLLPKVPNARLLVIGGGKIQESLSLAAPFWSSVIFTGKLSQQCINEMYAIADVGVMPSTQEQCSISSIEMRYHRLPVVVSSVEGLDEMFEADFDALKLPVHYDENQLIFFSDEELCERLFKILEDEALASQLATNAYLKATDMFTSERMCAAYDKVFRSFFVGHEVVNQ
ncbi:Glycosyltransferase involved in cell wall bisynthesis [Dyadobacter sp. SG02]|uniref:glycosyltransferase n=1 Tax=Dyadobacter sp. SG02 TaxID=1855291 RepID=UPI0008D505DF|nr:glycosyltransferase [Dyadobacter sp. SG02]SEJ75819.1 Glycosyltransferase involved in cell wall bisynthesis [Dyadobacter sp. SG02]